MGLTHPPPPPRVDNVPFFTVFFYLRASLRRFAYGHMGREDVFRRKKYTIPKLNAFLSILVPRVTSQNFKIGPLWDFEKRPF